MTHVVTVVAQRIKNIAALRRLEELTSPEHYQRQTLFRLTLTNLRVMLESWVLGLVYGPKYFLNLRETRRFLGQQRVSEALVIANGPSAARLKPEEVQLWRGTNKVIIAVNNFPVSEIGQRIRPDYLVLSDPLYGPESERLTRLVKAAEHDSFIILVPSQWLFSVRKSHPGVTWLGFDDRRGRRRFSSKPVIWKKRTYTSLTSLKALGLACSLKARQILIIGFDSNTFMGVSVDEGNRIMQASFHHEGSQTSDVRDISELHPNGMADYFFSLAVQLSDLRSIFRFAPIINLDENSITDCFPKLNNGLLD